MEIICANFKKKMFPYKNLVLIDQFVGKLDQFLGINRMLGRKRPVQNCGLIFKKMRNIQMIIYIYAL